VVEPLEIGKTYHLEVNSTLTGSSIQESLSFNPSTQLSDALHVTPYGFRPNDKKKAYLGLNMGSAGELDIEDLNFQVIRSSDQSVVYEGIAVLETSLGWRESFANAPYSHVYELNFSTLDTTGEYYLQHATGISQPFTIHSDAYRNGLNTLALGMYHQRRGEALTKPYTRFTHKATIEDKTYIYDSNDLDSWLTGLSSWGNGVKYPTTLEGQKIEISGGHMDAGDYSPYTYNSAMTAWTLITTLDVFGGRVAHDNLGLPESGDGIADLLQEFLIEINWLKDMQDPVDGGVFGMSKPKGVHYQSTMPGEDETLKRYLAPKDTTVTAGYAAALARAARSPLLQTHGSELTELLKSRAIKAWEWLAQNEGMHGYHHYGKAHPDGDDEGHEHARAWAAIELYALTGEQKYHDSFVQHHKPLQRDNGVYWMNEGYGYTIRTLVLWQRDKIPYVVDENLMSTSLERFRGAMDRYIEQSAETPYDLIVDRVIKRWNVVGWYFPISAFGWDLLVAHELYGKEKYLEVAQDQIHFTLGSNPSNMSYITGMGYKRLRSTVDQESRFDGIEEPVVGLPVSPMVSNYTWSNTYQRDISDYSYPKDNPDDNESVYGILESAYDGWNVNGEFTIEKMAGILSAFAILTPKSDKQYAYPEFNLSVTALGNGEYKPSIHFKNGEPSNYTVLWYENNEAVSANPNYILQQDFNNPTWKLSAEVVTLEGRRWYSEININTRDYGDTTIPLKAFEDNSSSTLFHFDTNLSDANNVINTLSMEGNTYFDDSNLNWMQNPNGSALRFNGFGDEVKTTLSLAPYLLEGKGFEDISELSVEGLFYIETLGEANANVLNLFYFVQSWGNGLQLTRYNWTNDIRADFGKTQNSGEELNNALSLHQWYYVQMIRTRTHDILKIDGVEYVRVAHDASKLFDHRDITFKFGNFYGWADEIRLNVKFEHELDTSFLPEIPTTPLHPTQIETDLEVRYDKIQSFTDALENDYNRSKCNVANFWDANRVMIGGRAEGHGEDVCKVQIVSNDNFDLNFLTKWPINNIHYPLTPEPAWARFRFPVPKDHVADEIEYEISWYKLFGSSPTNCHPNDLNESTGECNVDVSETWRDDVDAGLYLFWTTPNANEQVMTGPHAPIETIGYSGVDTFKAEVPDAFRDVEEVIVTFVAYNQYTKACDKENATKCTTHENENFRIRAVTLKSEKPFNPLKEPDVAHPRILGNNSEFKSYFGAFDALECIESTKDMGWGVVFNAKNIWDKNTKGVSLCRNDAPSSISEISDVQYYLNRQEGDSWKRDRALRVMFLLREMMDCHSRSETCLYSAEDVTLLKEAFIDSEMARFNSVSWDWGYKCFDIGTEPPIKFWSIFVDVFWNDLESADKEKIDSKLSEKIGCFIEQVENKDWSLFNGNNWTPILDKAALYWAIAYYHEDERAKDVVKEVLRTLWLHRDFYLEDGSYMEGVIEYTNVSYSNLREINNLMRQSFGEYLASVRWKRTEKTSRWYLDFMATDGRMADFGDSWDKRGWSTFDPLHMMLWEEMIGEKEVGSVNLDACSVQEYFSNVWFVKGFDDPWSVQPSMARDWQSIVESCNKSDINQTASILFDQAESAVFKSYIENASNIADEESMRFSQADYTWLGLNGVPNDFPHRELDFGALIWTAYGNRLLHDFGYGEIGKTSSKQAYLIQDGDLQLFDNLALGANTLVVEDATIEGYTGGNYQNDLINSSQIYGARGEVEAFDLNGHKAFVADGSAVYGRDDTEFGWLAYFFRYMVALDDGNFMVIDTFKSKDEQGDVNVKEYWHSSDESNLSECVYSRDKVLMGIEEPTVLTLKPLCSMLNREANSTVSANIIAASLQEGAFEIEPKSIHYKNRNGTEIYRKRAKYGSLTPVAEDIRVFLLQASPNAELPEASVTRKHGDALSACFDVSIAGVTKALKFKKVDGAFKIDTFTEGRCLEDETSWVTVSQDDNSATFSTIQAAFDSNASNILIKDGTYRVNTMLEIARDGVEIKGESRDGVIIEASNMSDEVVQDRDCYDLFHVDANHVTVSNVTLKQNPNCKNTTFVTGGNHHVVLKDSHLIGSEDMFTIFYAGPHHVNGPQPLAMFEQGELDHHNQVLNNIIDSTYWGDVLSFSMQKDGNVSGNTLNGGLIALFLDDNVTCEHNILNSPEARGIAISLPSKDVFVRYNTVTNSKGAGISTSRQSDYQDDAGKSLTTLDYRGTGIIIEANEVVDSRYHGIEVSNIKSSVIKNNDVTSTAHSGIYVVYSDELLIYKNKITDSNLVASGLKDSEHVWNPNWDSAIYFDTNVTTSRVSLNTIVGNNGAIQRGIAINPYNAGNTNNSLYWNSFEGGFSYEKVYSGDASNRAFENDITERIGNGLWLQILGEGNVTINSVEYNQSIHIPQDNIQSYSIKAVPHEGSEFIGWNSELDCKEIECTLENTSLLDIVARFGKTNE
jgi:parallel beta-helix repeat protein